MKKNFAVIILAGALVGCGSSGDIKETTNNKSIYTEVGTYPIVKEGYTDSFSVFAPLTTGVTTYDISVNPTTQFMKELTGVDLEFFEVTNADKKQKFNVMMTGGDYTDVILSMDIGHSELALYGSQGILIPLQDLIAEYAPNIQKALDEHPLIRDTWTLEDGNMYCIPKIGTVTHSMVPYRMWLNSEWLDNLNLQVPTTTEDFYQVLKAFKEQDANGNGDPNDEIPLSGAMSSGWNTNPIPYILSAFIPSGATSGYLNIDENGKVYYVRTTDEFKECLKYMNMLYEEGLIDPLLFSQTKDQLLKLGSNPDTVIMGATTGGSVSVFTNTTNYDRWGKYIVLPPLKGPEGVISAVHSPDYGLSRLSITNKCDNPEVVMRFFDYMFTAEGERMNSYGEKGIRYDDAPEGVLNVIGEQAEFIRIGQSDAFQDVSWNVLGPTYNPGRMDLDYASKGDTDIETVLYLAAANDYLPVAQDIETIMPKVAYTQDESRIVVDTTTNITVYTDQIITQFITGKLNIDENWDEYIRMLNVHGLDKYLDVAQKAYDRYKAK